MNHQGIRNPNVTLTVNQVRAIMREPCGYGAYKRIAAKYGVSIRTVQSIRLGDRWASVTGVTRE